uniref:Uncharacterized protein n=1 Tax=Anguilla anguilla TaxID=7936 RepID=A0A0E9TCG6_ANGAN
MQVMQHGRQHVAQPVHSEQERRSQLTTEA